MNHLYQRRTVKSPCCNTKVHVKFQYGALTIGAFCDCGRPFYLKFKKDRSHRKDRMQYTDGHYKILKHRAGKLLMKSDSNMEISSPMKKRRKKKQIKKRKKCSKSR